jgi:hypothetical protein
VLKPNDLFYREGLAIIIRSRLTRVIIDRRNKYGSRGSIADTIVLGVYILEGV